ncbi:MAG: 50S ribosomal protein L36 [Candidatus Magasanikbacteria bacterium]|nr:50S ribosomal protein L36 [Candidatus Magasanikbacteria bacterium]
MKKKSSAKKRCPKCKVLRRQGRLEVRCEIRRHNSAQGSKQRTKAA